MNQGNKPSEVATLQIGKWGNSLALRIPRHLSELLGLHVNDTVAYRVEDGRLVLEAVRKRQKYTLDELLSGEIESGEEISWGKPEGEEIW